MATQQMQIIRGVAASPGIAIGPAYVISDAKIQIDRPYIGVNEVKKELARFEAALAKTKDDLARAEEQVTQSLGAEYAQILGTHRIILQDPSIVAMADKKIKQEHMSAENAIFTTAAEISASFDKIDDDFFKERKQDIFDVTKRLFNNLSGVHRGPFADIKHPSIVVAHNLFPSDALSLKEHPILGFATDIGGKTSHSALLAQSLELPAVVGLSSAARGVQTGDIVILDGEQGALIINPEAEILEQYRQMELEFKRAEQELKTINNLPVVTVDGHTLELMINYDPRHDSKEQKKLKTDGLGLLRTEFMFMNVPKPPSEEEQVALYTATAKKFGSRPVYIRLADLGGDKEHSFQIAEEEEDNPFMGCRGVRFLLRYPGLMRAQIRAVIKTAAAVHARVHLMVPMVTTLEEVREVKKVFKQELKKCKEEGFVPKQNIPYGIMVEVPSAAFVLDTMLKEVDFVSIGTNDLIQYMMAVDRVNQNVSSLYDPYNPAVLRVISMIIQAAHQQKKRVSICGELASDPEIVPLLIGLGVDTLSTTSRMFLRIKDRIRKLNFDTCSNLSQAALLMGSSEEIKKMNMSVLDENP